MPKCATPKCPFYGEPLCSSCARGDEPLEPLGDDEFFAIAARLERDEASQIGWRPMTDDEFALLLSMASIPKVSVQDIDNALQKGVLMTHEQARDIMIAIDEGAQVVDYRFTHLLGVFSLEAWRMTKVRSTDTWPFHNGAAGYYSLSLWRDRSKYKPMTADDMKRYFALKLENQRLALA